MMKTNLSQRLQAVMGFAEKTPHKTLADIGTDHAYLPIAAVQSGISSAAIACDIHPGPLEIANKNILDAKLTSQIETRLGDGLAPLAPGEADCIVIAGMGGMRIWGILEVGMAQACTAKRLILQPQHDTMLLRKNLHMAGFDIEDECIVREVVAGREHFYVIIATKYTASATRWHEQEYFLGKYLMEKVNADFVAFKNREKEKINAYIAKLTDEKAIEDASQRLSWLK